tara:strand:- start:181 stop:282 length:102 start_codon:yes stop_codon:yes gene_type:complete
MKPSIEEKIKRAEDRITELKLLIEAWKKSENVL